MEGQTARAQQDYAQAAGCHLPSSLPLQTEAPTKDFFMSHSLTSLHNVYTQLTSAEGGRDLSHINFSP